MMRDIGNGARWRIALWAVMLALTSGALVHAQDSIDDLEKRVQAAKQAEAAKKAQNDKARPPKSDPRPAAPVVATPQTDSSKVQLESGISLADWLLIAESRLAKGELDQVLKEGAGYVRKYPAMPGLVSLMGRAVNARLDAVSVYSAESAAAAQPMVLPLLDDFPADAKLQLLAGRIAHLQGQFDAAAEHYKLALKALPGDGEDRLEVLQLFSQATSREPISTDIAAVKERPLPPIYTKYASDVEAALKCVGPATAGIDFTVVTQGIHPEEHMKGAAFNFQRSYQSVKRGLAKVTGGEVFDLEKIEVDDHIETLVAMWRDSEHSLSGRLFKLRYRTYAIACDQSLFPIVTGKVFKWQRVTETESKWSGTGETGLVSEPASVSDEQNEIDILEGPLNRGQAMRRFPFLHLVGPTAAHWRVYTVRQVVTSTARARDLPAARTANNPPTKAVYQELFVEGPNVLVSTTMSLRDETVTITETQ